jgi:signal transduction histidine kinase
MTVSSLRLRLLIGGTAFIVTALCLAAVGLSILFERHVERWVDGELVAYQNQLIAGLDATPSKDLAVTSPPADPRFERPLSGFYWQAMVEPAGPVLRSRSLWDYEIAQPSQTYADDKVHHYRVRGPQGSTLYLLQRRVQLPTRLGERIVLVAVALDAAEVRNASWRFASALAPFLALVGVLLTAAAWAQVAVGLKPLRAVRKRLAAIASGDERRLGSGFPTEVQPLAREIDSLLEAREQQAEKAKARAADLAHALKTPLQVLAGEIERLRCKGDDEIADSIEGLSSIMQRHVDRQLTRARLGSATDGGFADVASVVVSVVRVMERTPDGRRLAWFVDVPAGLRINMDAHDLAEALGNLIENATRHAQSCISICAIREPNFATVTVTDDGPGIASDRREDALQRGTRFDSTGQGAGLGLAIVADIAEAWGTTLTIDNQEPGLRVGLRVPVAPAQESPKASPT